MLSIRGSFKNRRFFPSDTLVLAIAMASLSLAPLQAVADPVACEIAFSGQAHAAHPAVAPLSNRDAKPADKSEKEETLADLLKRGSPVSPEERMAVEDKLSQIQNKLKTDFVGWDSVVEQLMNASRLLIFYGDDVAQKPVVVPILGFPGYGKTTLIQKWQKLMGFEDINIQENIEKKQAYIPFDKVLGAGRPARENDDVKKERPLVDFVFTVDEIQNLLSATQVDEMIKVTEDTTAVPDPTGENRRILISKREQALKIQKARQFWWEVLGNGTYQVRLTDPSPQLDTISTYLSTYMEAVEVRRKAEIKIRKFEAATDVDHEADIDGLTSQITSNEHKLSSYKSSIMNALKKIKYESSESLGNYASLPATALLEVLEKGPDEFIELVSENYRKASASSVLKRFNRGIIIVTGNPNSIIDELVKKSTAGNGRIDPESLRRNTLQVSDQEIMNFFVEKIGPEPGWQSRLNAGNWKILPPFGEKQWRDLIRRSLTKFDDLTAKDGHLFTERKVSLRFDESLINQLYASAVDPMGGPRNYFDALNQSLTVLPTQVPLQLRRYMELHSAWKDSTEIQLHVSFSSETKELIVRDESGSGFESRMRLALNEKANRDQGIKSDFPAISKAQMAVYQAARVVVGTVLFRSLPKNGVESVPTAEETIESMWSQPDVNHFEHLKAKLMVSMSGYIAEKMVMDKSGVDISPNAKLDMEYIATMIGQLKAELERRRELSKYKADRPESIPLRELFGESMSQDKIVAAIFRNDDKAVFRYLDAETKAIMVAQKDLINALASNLLNKPRLETEEIRAGFEIYSKRPGFVSNAVASIKRLLGGSDVAPVPQLDIKHIVKHERGSIQNPLPGLAQPYSLDHRQFPATKLGRFTDNLKKRLSDDLPN